ncbi:hypothetical protein JZO73_14350 [Enterococcus plantarum]|uniref:hypothetical protein n=1 Tax=Enterococcus plantarum TaxID=1077675 RepID=UPI001A8CF8F5|nr:hypothetical protein [Enterococcus plantarum]MBO0468687.1 hypothetical protein [Enterococcus plantarum]
MGVLIIAMLFLIKSKDAYAEEKQYENNGSVGFYGEYVKEKDKTSDKDKPNIEIPEAKIPEVTNPIVEKPIGRLPAAGTDPGSSQIFFTMGISCCLAVAILFFKKERI